MYANRIKNVLELNDMMQDCCDFPDEMTTEERNLYTRFCERHNISMFGASSHALFLNKVEMILLSTLS